MNTIVKLEEALLKRDLSLYVLRSNTNDWIVQLVGPDRTTAACGEGASLELAITYGLKRWDADTASGTFAAPPSPEPDLPADHPDLPGHEHCWQSYCATCRAPLDRENNAGWTTCQRLTCPSCRAGEEKAAHHENHPIEHFLDLDYPVTIYESDEDRGFVAECKNLPGTAVEEETVEGAYERAKQAAELWIETAAACGQRIPLPSPPPLDRFKFPRPRREEPGNDE